MKHTAIYLTIVLCISINTRIFSDPEPLEPLKFSLHKHEKNIESPAPEQQHAPATKDKHVAFAQTTTEITQNPHVTTQQTIDTSAHATTENHLVIPVQNTPAEQKPNPTILITPSDNKPTPTQSTMQDKSSPRQHKNGKPKKKQEANMPSKTPSIADAPKVTQSATHTIASIVTIQAFLPEAWSTIPLYSFAPDGRFACLNTLTRTRALQGLAAIACAYGVYKIIAYYCSPENEYETF